MLARTHLAFALLSGLFAIDHIDIHNKIAFFVFVLVGALIIDIDHPKSKLGRKIGFVSGFFRFLFGHRGLFHSIFFTLMISYLVYSYNHEYGIALFIGCLSHLFADGLTKQGINFLHPVSKLHLSGFVETGGFLETVLFLVISLIITIKLYILAIAVL